ncbi:hypothetical protein ACFFX0_25155 [Citricoccus parietis]|uniref:Uncharacterized protein n=1 Tax=Citricoccus parietis TaxID=592307 RepID=A0ABV5G5X0_9MICC
MVRVDAGVDHRDRDALALAGPPRVTESVLVQPVLPVPPFIRGGGGQGGPTHRTGLGPASGRRRQQHGSGDEGRGEHGDGQHGGQGHSGQAGGAERSTAEARGPPPPS